jgi:hypothetical protein
MDRDLLAEGVRGIHRRFHLLERERLELSHVVEAAGQQFRELASRPVSSSRCSSLCQERPWTNPAHAL